MSTSIIIIILSNKHQEGFVENVLKTLTFPLIRLLATQRLHLTCHYPAFYNDHPQKITSGNDHQYYSDHHVVPQTLLRQLPELMEVRPTNLTTELKLCLSPQFPSNRNKCLQI